MKKQAKCAKVDMEADPSADPSGRTPGAAEWPPAGLTFEERTGSSRPFRMRWREPGGKKRPARAFETAAERDRAARAWAKQKATWGEAAPMVRPKQAEVWRIFEELTGGADPLAVARFWLRFRDERGGTMTVAAAAERFLDLRTAASVARDSATHLALHVRRFVADLGALRLADLTADEVRGWLAKLAPGGVPAASATARHHLRSIKFFLATAVAERWAVDNPAAAVPLPSGRDEDNGAAEVCVLSVEEAERLFRANADALVVGKLALEAFAGLRYTSAARIAREEILDGERALVLERRKHKSGRRHYVDGYPANLWKWIARAPRACWEVTARQYLDLKREAFERAEVANPGNVLRHSFCSYHVAQYKDAARTAVLLTHRSPAMLYQHYKGRATAADARRYFAILPG